MVLVFAVQFPLLESCGENQNLFLWAVLLKQKATEVIRKCCLAPEPSGIPRLQAEEDVKQARRFFR